MTRVLFVNPGGALGGAEHTLLLLVRGLRMRGIDVSVALLGDGPLRGHLNALGVSSVTVPTAECFRRAGRYGRPGSWRSVASAAGALPIVFRVARLARRLRMDLIHTNGTKAHLVGGLAGRISRVPVVWHLHDFPPSGTGAGMFRVASRRLPSAMLATSEAVGAAFRRAVGSALPMITVYNPVDLGGFHPGLARDQLRRGLGLGNDVPIVGLVAHLTPWKGHHVFLTIASALADSPRRPHFVIAGGPVYETDGHAGYAEALRQRAIALGISDRVTFLGARDDIADVLAGLDMLLHTPTAPEPFGRVLAEAMAVGRPVVASRCGGIPEVVEDGRTGLLVAPGDTAGFTSAVNRLLDDAVLSEELGRAGRQRVEARFGLDPYIDRIIAVYRDIIAVRQARP